MWPHARVAWWDIKRGLAMRGRRIVAAIAFTAAAGAGLAASAYYGSPPEGARVPKPPAATEAPAAEPTIPWPAPAAASPSAPSTTTPTFVSPTQPWPGTTPSRSQP